MVLKAVSDVKKLRAAATKSLAASPVQAKSAGKSRGGKKKGAIDEAFAPEFKEAMSPPVRVGVQQRPTDADGGTPPSLPAAQIARDASTVDRPKGSLRIVGRPAAAATLVAIGYEMRPGTSLAKRRLRAPIDRRGGDDTMLKTFIRTTACLAMSATAFIVVTKMDATAAKPRSPSVPEASQPKPAPSKPRRPPRRPLGRS